MTDFVLTQDAKKRIALIEKYTKLGIPVLLVGATGTGKTASAEKSFEHDTVKKFNFSAETTIDQLIGHPSIDSSTNNIIFQSGPYLDAYENGYSLILDEFNLAHEDVLQCIEASLDSNFITIDDPIEGIKQIPMNKNFKLVATQNEAEFDFARKRNKLTTKLTSKFVVIKFEIFSKKELITIAQQMDKQIEIDDETIKKIVKFHSKWNFKPGNNYTIRNMKGVIQSISDKVSAYQAILFNYGSSCDKSKLSELLETMEECNIMKDEKEVVYEFPELNNCFRNKSIEDVFQRIQFFAEQDQPILLVGDDGCGKTQIAKWAADIMSKNGSNMMVCTPETTISDLIGNYIPFQGQGTIGKLPVKWIDGPIVRSAIEGKCIILDQIECALPQYIERINPLFDSYSKKRYLGDKATFIINERPSQNEINIKDGFKFIATACRNDLNKLSPALLNRFVIINIENQLSGIEENTFTEEFFSSVVPKTEFDINIKKNLFSHIRDQSISTIVKIIKGIEALKGFIPNMDNRYNILKELFIDKITPKLNQKNIDIILREIDDTSDFHFRGVYELENIIALMVILKIIGQHCILQSTTGFGKTSSAMMLAKVLRSKAYKVAFNNETKISDLFNNLTITKGSFNNASGQLYSAMKDGGFFVADEINLAETTVMESLTIALEQKGGETINLPNCEEPIVVSNDFFFIGCQNDTNMFGRKLLPHCIVKKVVKLEYPFPENKIEEIIKNIFMESELSPINTVNAISNLVKVLRNDEEFSSRPWSFREVRRYMNRCIFFNNKNTKIKTVKGDYIPSFFHAAYMIYSTFSNPKDHINSIINVIKESFDLPHAKVDELHQTLKSPVRVEEKTTKIIIKKGNIQQTLEKKGVRVDKNAEAYWETLFLINMVPSNEPLLITGPSGYKTFIAKQVCEFNKEETSILSPRVVTLSKDSNTSSLIGNTALVDHSSFNTFIFDMLYSIAASYPELTLRISDLKKTFRGNDDIEELNSIVLDLSNRVPDYKFIIDNLHANLMSNIKAQDSQSLMKDYTTAFKPGLITAQILQRRTLILKNFSKPPVAVMERFNELFSIIPELTLTEDYSNTIVPAERRTIRLPGKGFRIIATCGENETSHLSEAMLSRLNVVYTRQYLIKEQKAILQDLFTDKNKNNFIFGNLIAQIARDVVANAEISKEKIDTEKALNIAINLMNNKEESATGTCFPLTVSGGVIRSKFSPIVLITNIVNFPKTNLVFTPSVQVMADRIFSAFALNRPIIISGPNGNGKSETVEYVASCIGIQKQDIISIQISHSTTIENIYGRNGIREVNGKRSFDFIPTQLLKAVADHEDYNDGRKKLIIIQEINLATQSVLDALAPLFDNDPNSRILQQNGSDIGKKKFYIVGLASGSFTPEGISSGPIIFQKDDYPLEEFELICSDIMKRSELFETSKIEQTASQLGKLKHKLEKINMGEALSVRCCMEYNMLESIFNTSSKLTNYASDIVFNSQFDQKYVNVEKNPVTIEMSGSSLCVSNLYVDVNTRASKWEINKSNVHSLSESEQQLFVLLAANAYKKDTRFPLIVKGPTASGKTYTIQLFANIIGQKLTVLQMNSDSSVSSIIGGYKPSETVTKNKIEVIKEKVIACGDIFNNIISEIEKTENITTKHLYSYLETMNQALNEDTDTETSDLIKEAIAEIEDACSLFNRIELSDSVFVDAMVNGNWILLDGIESAPSDIIERIITLLDNSPMLNLYEYGNNCVYSAHPINGQTKIHDNFRIFITYNPDIPNKKTILTNTVLSRCVVFTMKPFDETEFSSSVSAYYNLADSKYEGFSDKKFIATKIGTIHICRKKREEDSDNRRINGRTLIHICRALSNSGSPVKKEQLMEIIKENYSSSITSNFEEVEGLVEDFNKRIKKSVFEKLDNLTKQTLANSEVFVKTIGRFMSAPRYIDLLDLTKKIDFVDLFNIREKIDQECEKMIEAALKENKSKSEYLFQALLFSKISRIIEDIEKITTEGLKHNSLSNIDLNEFPGFSKNSFLLDRITEICSDINTKKQLPLYLLNEEETGDYESIIQHVKTLALLQTDKDNYERYLPHLFKEIYKSYLLCIEEKNTNEIHDLDIFYKKMITLTKENGYNLEISKLLEDPNNIKTFSEMELSICTNEIQNIIEEFKKRIVRAPEESNSTARSMFFEQARRIIQRKGKNYNKYELLTKIFERVGFELPNDCIQQVKDQFNSEKTIEYDFTAHHQLETSESQESTQWFADIVNYNYLIKSIDQLSDPSKCFKALISLSEEISVDEIIFSFKDNAFRNIELFQKFKNEIKHKYFAKMIDGQETENLIIPENMVKKLNSFYNKEGSSISLTWTNTIKNLNTKVDLDLVIEIPKITTSDFIFIARKLFPEFKFTDSSKVSDVMEIISKAIKSDDKINIMKELEKHIDSTVEFSVPDAIKYDDNLENYFNKNPSEAIFLSINTEAAKALSSSLSQSNLTYGIFLLRLYSPLSLITFYTNNEMFTKELKQKISEVIIKLLKQNKFESFALIASFLLDPAPSILQNKFTSSLFHDSIVQIVSYSNNMQYQSAVNDYLPWFVEFYLGRYDKFTISQWNKNITDSDWTKSFLLNPIKVFIDNVNRRIDNISSELDKEKANIDNEIYESQTKIKGFGDLFHKSCAEDKNLLQIKFKKITAEQENFEENFAAFSSSFLAYFNSLPEAVSGENKMFEIPDTKDMFLSLKKLNLTELPNSRKLTMAFIQTKSSDAEFEFEIANGDKIKIHLKEKQNILFKIPDDMELKDADKSKILYVYVSKLAQPSQKIEDYRAINFKLNNALHAYSKIPLEQQEKMNTENRNEKSIEVVFGNNSLSDFIEFINEVPRTTIENELTKYSDIRFNGSNEIKPENTIKKFDELMQEAKKYDNTINRLSINETNTRGLPDKLPETLLAKDFQYRPESLQTHDNMEIRFDTIKDLKPLNIPTITIDNNNVSTNFTGFTISVENVLLGIQTTNIKVNIFCFGNQKLITFEIIPDDETPSNIFIEKGEDLVTLNIPIARLRQDTLFSGKINIINLEQRSNIIPIKYSVKVTFRNPTLFLESPGNKFKYEEAHEKFVISNKCYDGEIIKLLTKAPGVNNLKQQVTFEYYESKNVLFVYPSALPEGSNIRKSILEEHLLNAHFLPSLRFSF